MTHNFCFNSIIIVCVFMSSADPILLVVILQGILPYLVFIIIIIKQIDIGTRYAHIY